MRKRKRDREVKRQEKAAEKERKRLEREAKKKTKEIAKDEPKALGDTTPKADGKTVNIWPAALDPVLQAFGEQRVNEVSLQVNSCPLVFATGSEDYRRIYDALGMEYPFPE